MDLLQAAPFQNMYPRPFVKGEMDNIPYTCMQYVTIYPSTSTLIYHYGSTMVRVVRVVLEVLGICCVGLP